MNGDFYVRSGLNDFGIEDELSGFDVELINYEEKSRITFWKLDINTILLFKIFP